MTDADVLDDPIDARACLAAARLRMAASMRPLPDRRPARRGNRRVVAVAVAVVVLVVAGLIAIGSRDGTTEPAGPNDDLHWLIDDLADGWRVAEVRGPGGTMPDVTGWPTLTLFGSAEAPGGPVLEVTVYDAQFSVTPAQSGAAGATGFEEHVLDGVDVVLATGATGARLAWAKLDGGWVAIRSEAVDDDALIDAAAHVVVEPDGSAQILGAHLPAGVHELASGSTIEIAPAWWAGYAAQGTLPGVLTVGYELPGTAQSVSLTVSRTVGGQPAYFALTSDELVETEVDGLHVWVEASVEEGSPRLAGWVRDDRFFLLTSFADLDLPAIAASVTLASAGEWSRELDTASTVAAPGDTELPAGTYLAEGPADTDPPTDTIPPTNDAPDGDGRRDVSIDWIVTDRGPHEATLAAELPDGTRSELRVTIVGGSAAVSSSDLGAITFGWGDDDADVLTERGLGAIALTRDPEAAQLRITTTDGDRYIVPLVSLTGVEGTAFAALTLPPGSVSSMALLDRDGTVLAESDGTYPAG